MNTTDAMPKVRTLGRFCISVSGEPVATEWPDEAMKVFFCSLLSPLDLYFTWDRICRSMWGIPATRTSRLRLEKLIIRPLHSFLVKELGFNPLISGPDGIKVDQQNIHVDAHEFYCNVLEGLRLLSVASNAEALERFSRASLLYAGSYLPGMPGKIIENARHDLESLYRSAVMEGVRRSRSTRNSRTTLPAAPPKHRIIIASDAL